MNVRPQPLALVPVALIGFGGGYLLGHPSHEKAKASPAVPVPATFQVSKSQPSIPALGTATGYPPLVRVHTTPRRVNTGGGPGTQPPATTQPTYTTNPPTTQPPPPPPSTTTSVVTTTS
jgi:hypothetical protein